MYLLQVVVYECGLRFTGLYAFGYATISGTCCSRLVVFVVGLIVMILCGLL